MKAKLSIPKFGVDFNLEGQLKELNELVNGFIPLCIKEAGGLIQSNIAAWKLYNTISVVRRYKQLMNDNNLEEHEVPIKVFFPLVNNASLEEEESMQAKWANLLANAASGNVEVKPAYTEILKELSPLEVMLLDRIYDEAQKEQDYAKRMNRQYGKEAVCKIFPISSEDFDVMLENLIRLNLCRYPGAEAITYGPGVRSATITTEIFEMTALGFRFIKACRPPLPAASIT